MNIGLLITTHNRPEYLARTLESLSRADLCGAEILIVDDFSTNRETLRMLKGRMVTRLPRNMGVRHALCIGFDRLLSRGHDVLVNLDSDAVVRADFLVTLLALYEQFPDHIISGFNTLTPSARTGQPRHPILSWHEGYVRKHSIGGLNMLLSAQTYQDIVRPALIESQSTKKDWDRIACRMSAEQGKDIIVASPSVVQHIGFTSAMGHADNPDVADDFVDEYKQKMCVLQPHGLGDIIFCQTLVRSFMAEYEITWAVHPDWVEGLSGAYPDINWVTVSPVSLEVKEDKYVNGYHTLPIRWSDTIMKVPYRSVMGAKYGMYGQDYLSWTDQAMWVRNKAKEDELFELLGLTGKEYVLKNTHFSGGEIAIAIAIGVQGVAMRQIDGFSLFDWAKVLENAKEIHTVSTSLLFVLGLLSTGPVYVYTRGTNKKHDEYDYLFTPGRFNFQ